MGPFVPTKPGWYPNPADRSTIRYWDGCQWASRQRPRPPWATGVADLNPAGDRVHAAMEGPVHPQQLREPVTSGASGREAPGLWRSLQSQRAWHRPGGLPPGPLGAPDPGPATKFGPARQPLLVFVAVMAVAAAVVVLSVALMAPYERDGLPRSTAQPANAQFILAADQDCRAALAPYRAGVLSAAAAPAIVVAADHVDRLRRQLSRLRPGADDAYLDVWLGDWARMTRLERQYAALVSSAQLSSADEAEALQLHRQAVDDAGQADSYVSRLGATDCQLLVASAP